MKRSRRRAHYNCADLEWNLTGKRKRIPAGNFHEFRVTAVAMLTDHLSAATELFRAAHTKFTRPAVDQIVYTDPIARRDVRDICANLFDAPGNFMPERNGQIVDRGNTAAVMRVRVTDSSSGNANQNIGRTDLGNWNFNILQRPSDLHESHRSHFQTALRAL